MAVVRAADDSIGPLVDRWSSTLRGAAAVGLRLGLWLLVVACTAAPPDPGNAFSITVVRSDLVHPTAIRFGPTGRVWVAQQGGMIEVFEDLADATPALRADLTDRVLGRNNRGLLGLAPDPTDPAAAFVLFTFPAPPGVDQPVWKEDASNCPDGTTRSCVSTGILSRVAFAPDGTATETELIRAWCHHHASHAPNDLAFGPDGALYASAGEGSIPEIDIDDGTWLPPEQRCNDGAFASRAAPNERQPGEWAGSVVRFAAADLAAVAEGTQPDGWLAQRAAVVAYGLRNPFRMTFRPGTPELWIGDPGWETWEEVNVIPDAGDTIVEDFGWPCREGREPAPHYSAHPRCSALSADPSAAVEPWFVERVGEQLDPSDSCRTKPSSISGIAFAPDGWPAPHDTSLFFADFSRGCLYALPVLPDGQPDTDSAQAIWSAAGLTVDLTRGPDGALYAVEFGAGTISRIALRR